MYKGIVHTILIYVIANLMIHFLKVVWNMNLHFWLNYFLKRFI